MKYVILGIIFILAVSYGGWYFKRVVNYNFMYKSMVQQTIRDMVKSEALK